MIVDNEPASLAAPGEGLARLIDRIDQRLMWLEVWICSAALMVMSVSILVSVIIRYAGIKMTNYGELALVCMAPLSFVGAALCYARGTHIAVDILRVVRNRRFNCLLNLGVILMCLGFALIFFYFGGQFFIEFIESGEIMMDVGTPLYVPAFFFPLGMLMLAIHALFDLIRIFLPATSSLPGVRFS